MASSGFMDVVRDSQWIDFAEFTDQVSSANEEVSSFVYLQETTGTKHPETITGRQFPTVDALIAIPVVLLRTDTGFIGDVDLASLPLHPWEPGIYPTSFYSADGYRFELLQGSIRLTSEQTQLDIPVASTVRFRNLVERLSCLTLLVEHRGSCTGVTFSNGEYSQIGLLPILLTQVPKTLSALLDNPRSISPIVIEKLDLYLDRKALPPASEYRTYSSSRTITVLPKIRWLTYCVCCGAEEVTREHCTPDWLCGLLGVEPVVADIFCGSCNSYFGEALESPIAMMCHDGAFPTTLSPEQLDLMARWFVKTALTVALASGVRFELSWFSEIRNDRIPYGLFVEFSLAIKTHPDDPLYTYGVSHFSDELVRNNAFLFTFACPYFSFYVRRSDPHMQAPFMDRIWPQVKRSLCMPPELESHADFHELQHCMMTREDVVHVPITGRKASPRN